MADMAEGYFSPQKIRTALFWVLALPVLYALSRYNYNLFHSLADGASIVIAASAFTIVWTSRRRTDNDYFLYAGIAFLFFAFLDLIHMLGNKGMGVFPGYGNLGPTFYIASRYVLSLSLLIAPFFIHRRLNTTLMFAAYSAVTLLILLSVFRWDIFPACIVEGVGLTPFKVISDYFICLILLASIGVLLRHRRSFDARVLRLIVASLILSIATGLTFTLYTDPFGITNTVGHFFQIASFYLVYLAFIETSLTKPQEILFRKLKQNEESLTQSVQQLDAANVELKQEIAERKQAEAELQKLTQELGKANRDLESFSYSVSHDLRAPLRAIDGYARMIGKKQADQFDAETRRQFSLIRDSVRGMGKLIEDLLAFSRLGRQEITRAPIDMASLFGEVGEEVRKANPARRIDVKLDGFPPALGDRALIRQVLKNIFENAVKFTAARETARIEAGARGEGNETVYYVKDNGVGFDMSYHDKLFDVFQRLHSPGKYEGSGIGLSIVQRIIQRHGGRIWAEGEVDKGATFYFTLPALPE
jgi:signal transduction histidine kinase